MGLHTQGEIAAFANLVTAAAVNKPLLMRILVHLGSKELTLVHGEVAALDGETRRQVTEEISDLLAPHHSEDLPAEKSALPVGREDAGPGAASPKEEQHLDPSPPVDPA